jgi:hypothetical protein
MKNKKKKKKKEKENEEQEEGAVEFTTALFNKRCSEGKDEAVYY